MAANQAYAATRATTCGKVVPFRQDVTPELRERNVAVRESKRYEVSLTRNELPLTVQYGDKTYILVLTKSNKLLLQKSNN